VDAARRVLGLRLMSDHRVAAKFILIGLYTGTRAGAIVSASPYRQDGHSFVDLDQCHLLSSGNRPPRDEQAPNACADFAAAFGTYALVGSPRRGRVSFRGVARCAGEISQDRLQACRRPRWSLGQGHAAHAATHSGHMADCSAAYQSGKRQNFSGMSAEALERTYGHHHPDYMRAATQAITSKQSQNVSLVIP
jgi:hypothetical protein